MGTLTTIYQYLLAILAFSFIIIVHELGHFIMARISGMHVQEFFIGFGPKLLKYKSKRSGTTYGISAIPLGGYNKILGMDKGEEVPKELEDKSYENKPQYKKFLVIIGGVAFNILIAVLLIAVFLGMGVYKPTNTIDYIQPGSPAEEHNLQIGDKVTALDGKDISSWEEFSTITKNAEDRNVTYTIIRNGEKKKINVSLDMRDGDKFLGVSPKTVKEYLSFTEVVKQSFTMTWDITKTYGQLIGMLVRGELSFSEARPVSPVGVISIFQQSASMGIQNFILFVALVSLLLGFGNLIPILPLDGGHIVVLIIESIRGRPVSKKVLEVITSIGIFLLVSLLIVGFVYDIISPFNINNM